MLSAVFIVRDEVATLPRALASLGDLPEIVVCDTGSHDGTPALAARLGARVSEARWTADFAAARTLAQANARFDWVMRVDADEVFHVEHGAPGDWLAATIARAERRDADLVYVLRRYSPHNVHWFPRLFRASRFRWTGPVHEALRPLGERRRVLAAPGAVFLHRPQARPRGYAALAEAHLLRAPGDPHLRYHRAQGLYAEGRLAAAIEALRAYLAGPADYRFHRGEAHRMLGVALARLGDPGAALPHLVEAALGDGVRAEAILALVELLLARRERAEARRWIARAADASPPRERAPWGGWRHPYLLHAPAWAPATWRRAGREAG